MWKSDAEECILRRVVMPAFREYDIDLYVEDVNSKARVRLLTWILVIIGYAFVGEGMLRMGRKTGISCGGGLYLDVSLWYACVQRECVRLGQSCMENVLCELVVVMNCDSAPCAFL